MPLVDRVFGIPIVREIGTVMFVYGQAGGGILAAGLANRALFALLPGLLLVVSLIGFLVRDPAVQQAILAAIGELVPPVQELLVDTLSVLAAGAVGSTIVSLVVLAWAASGFFKALDVTMAVILGTDRRRDPILRGVMSLIAVTVVLGVLAIGIVLVVLAWNFTDRELSSTVDPLVFRVLTIVGLAVVLAVLLAAAYRWIPEDPPPWSAIRVPAVLVSVALAVITQLFTLVAPMLVGIASLYGAIAAVFALLIWLQVSMNLVVMGVAWVRIRSGRAPDLANVPWPTGTLRRPDEPAAV